MEAIKTIYLKIKKIHLLKVCILINGTYSKIGSDVLVNDLCDLDPNKGGKHLYLECYLYVITLWWGFSGTNNGFFRVNFFGT